MITQTGGVDLSNKEINENVDTQATEGVSEAPRIRMRGLTRPVAKEKVDEIAKHAVIPEGVDLTTPVAAVDARPVKAKSPWRFVWWGLGGIGGLLFAGVAFLFIAGSMADPAPATASVAVTEETGQAVVSSAVSEPSEGASVESGASVEPAEDPSALAASGDDSESATEPQGVSEPSDPSAGVQAVNAPVSTVPKGKAVYENRLLKLSIEYPSSLYIEEKQDKAMQVLRDSGVQAGSDLFRGDLVATLPLVEFSLKDKWNTHIALAVVPEGADKVDSVFSFLVDGDFTVSNSAKEEVGAKTDRFDVLTYTLKNEYMTMFGSQTHLMQGGNMLVAAVASENKAEMLKQSASLKSILQSIKITK